MTYQRSLKTINHRARKSDKIIKHKKLLSTNKQKRKVQRSNVQARLLPSFKRN